MDDDAPPKRSLDSSRDPTEVKRLKMTTADDASILEERELRSRDEVLEPAQEVEQAKKDRREEGKRKKGKDGNNPNGGYRRRGSRPDGAAKPEGQMSTPRQPKRQCALLIGFCGSGYNGMQIQSSVRTIEGTLFEALVAAGAVSQDNADDPVKVGLNRAARTDAGVHAAGNVVSMKLITVEPDIIQRINDKLPPEIRAWSFQRVQNSFSARHRKYTYFFPTYILIPPKPGSAFHTALRESWRSQNTMEGEPEVDPFWRDVDLTVSREEDMVRKKAWRVDQEKVDALRVAAKRFLGTHNFHNFTVQRDFKDRSCQRHMKTIEISDPVVYGDTEWISVMLHGQSFMLHQIVSWSSRPLLLSLTESYLQRKMMCVLVMLVRTGTPDSLIEALYCPRTVAVPKMPSLGLLLECPIFESYNTRVETISKEGKLKPTDADYRGPIDFEKHEDQMLRFKEEFIYKRMRDSEERANVFDRWLMAFDRYSGNDLLYYNPLGAIPDAAVITKGERRQNTFKDRKRFDATDFSANGSAISAVLADDDDAQDEEEEVMGKKDLEEAEG